ncbi:hypothetical protein LSUB1_G006775 [Lachnellula subtilissima]|uniref:Ubiquitin-like domain-containing protein n=1 Tax=Lachnellula subtilissima TaxID=602034 RepID=A0A8H8RJL7_9HELO|nr:hypothetical protein LSUB1_G006775 [Lachnellula subtilissima]
MNYDRLRTNVVDVSHRHADEASPSDFDEIQWEGPYPLGKEGSRVARRSIEKMKSPLETSIAKGRIEKHDAAATKAGQPKEQNDEAQAKTPNTGTEKILPIKFKDAVGRKFSFPWNLCSTWASMEELIRQAFLHVDIVGAQVQAGRYDLLGPNGEIILPQVWEQVIEPDMAITMQMWPMPEASNLPSVELDESDRSKKTQRVPSPPLGGNKTPKRKGRKGTRPK